MARIYSPNYSRKSKPSQLLPRSTFFFRREMQTAQSVPTALQIPRGRIRLVPPALSEKCETYPGLHDIIRNKFLDIVNKWFKVVPSAHDYYFYCPDYSPMDNNVSFFWTKYVIIFVPSREMFSKTPPKKIKHKTNFMLFYYKNFFTVDLKILIKILNLYMYILF